MIDCRQAVDRLWAYLDRHLERAREEELEAHLGLCRHCCGELEFAKQIRSKIAAADEPIPPTTSARLVSLVRRLEGRG